MMNPKLELVSDTLAGGGNEPETRTVEYRVNGADAIPYGVTEVVPDRLIVSVTGARRWTVEVSGVEPMAGDRESFRWVYPVAPGAGSFTPYPKWARNVLDALLSDPLADPCDGWPA